MVESPKEETGQVVSFQDFLLPTMIGNDEQCGERIGERSLGCENQRSLRPLQAQSRREIAGQKDLQEFRIEPIKMKYMIIAKLPRLIPND